MRKIFLIGACLFVGELAWGDVEISTTPPTTADTGETVSAPAPRAMTLPPEKSFVTLTREPGVSLPAHADIVYPDETRAYDSQHAADALSRQAGILFFPQGSPGYPLEAFVRGSSARQTLILMDGRPLSSSALSPTDLSEIPLQQIDHIEIVRGGLSSLYGPNAMGGVINIISKRAVHKGSPISHVTYEGASYDRQTYKMDFGSRYGPVDFFFFGDQKWQSGFRSSTDNQQFNIGGNVGVSMGKAGKVLLDTGGYRNRSGIPGFRCDDIHDASCPTSTAPLMPHRFNNKDEKPAGTPFARKEVESDYLRTSYLVNLPSDIFVATRLFAQRRETDFIDILNPQPANTSSYERRERSTGGELEVHLPLGFLAGGTFLHDRADLSDRLTASNSFSAKQENWGLFAQNTLQFFNLTLIPSGRFDRNSQFGETWNPHVTGIHDTTEWLRFSASGGRAFRSPSFDEYRFNSSLRPEKAWTYDAGFELHTSSKSLKTNYFRANVGDEIQASTFSATNTVRSRRQGMEVQIEYVWSASFKQSCRYTYLENLVIPSGMTDAVEAAYSPRHTVHYLVVYKPSLKWEINPTLRYEDSRYSGNNRSGTKMGSQMIMDMRFAYTWRQMEVFFGVTDVLNKRYVEQPGYPLPGTAGYGGVRIRLWG